MANPNPNMSGLKPNYEGRVTNPKGRPKGSRSLSTIIRNVAENIEAWDKIPVKNKDIVAKMGAPMDAVVMVAFGQAIAGDKSAREWLRKAGYGDKLDITSYDKPIQTATVVDLGNVTNLNKAKSDSTGDTE